MKVLVTGSTGLVGRELMKYLEANDIEVHGFARPADWNPDAGLIHHDRLEGIDAVVHLAGENIAGGRWTSERKQRILQSRVTGTRLLAESLARLKHPPKVLVSASAIGYYGNRGDEILTESSPAGRGFLPRVCTSWEQETEIAGKAGIRVVRLRIGIVLSAYGGALPKMARPFRVGFGGILGDGHQYMSWITLKDLCRVIHYAITTNSMQGPVNAVAPEPATNREFTSALATALKRPAMLPVPRFAVRAALGDLADELLLASTRVVPWKLMSSGFQFHDSDLRLALKKNLEGVSTLRRSQFIARPPDEVFPFFSDANNLEHITPPWLHFEVLNRGVEIQRGTLIDYTLRVHGVPLRWTSEITDWDPPYRFVDVQRRGPYSLWEHEHRFEPRDGGTLVHDEIRYAAPGGSIVRKFLVAPDLERIFNYRKARLEQLFA